jgi:hypothetical protein
MNARIFAYCERGLDPAFWAEPLNALSNAAFLIAAWWAWRTWRQSLQAGQAELGLVALLAVIGAGSFLFHTFATRWAALADVIPPISPMRCGGSWACHAGRQRSAPRHLR